MAVTGFNHEVYNRYNVAISSIVIVIAIVTLTFAYAQFQKKYHSTLASEELALRSSATAIDSLVEPTLNALLGMRDFAEFTLDNPELSSVQLPMLQQEGELFYRSEKPFDVFKQGERLSTNIVGVGDLAGFHPAGLHEIAMADALAPAFISARENKSSIAWVSYLSNQKFVSIYPWRSRQFYQFKHEIFRTQLIKEIKERKNFSGISWSPSSTDIVGDVGLISSAIPIKRQGEFVGVIQVDFYLRAFEHLLPKLDHAASEHYVLLLDESVNVITLKDGALNKEEAIKTQNWLAQLPVDLRNKITKSNYLGPIKSGKYDRVTASDGNKNWVIQKVGVNDSKWQLLHIEPQAALMAPVIKLVAFQSGIVFLVLSVLLGLIYIITRRLFVFPTRNFISHIEHCAEGDLGVVKPTKGWQHWFKVVEDIFTQNRSLLYRLQRQNAELDAVVTDKTKALQARVQRHERDNALLRSVLNAIPEYIIIHDTDGAIVGCNNALLEFLKVQEEKLVGKQASTALPVELAEKINRQNTLPSSEEAQAMPSVSMLSDGSAFEVYCAQFYNDNGEAYGSIDVIRDVTSQHASQIALANAKEQAENANQAKSQFLANMSHEIRTPLNAIQGMVALLDSTRLSSVQQQYLANAGKASDSLLHLIDDLLDFTRIESGNMSLVKEQTSIDEIIEQAIKLNAAAAALKRLDISVDIATNVPKLINTDAIRLMQVVSNLLNNAVKFTAKGQIAIVLTTRFELDQQYLSIKVIDSGIGIEKHKQAHLFDVFTQADESMTREYGGSGLGLSICKQIVSLLQGKISLESEIGTGCEFDIVIPIDVADKLEDKHKSIVPITIYNIGVSLSAGFINSVITDGHNYELIANIEEVPKSTNQGTLVMVDDECLASALRQNRDITTFLEKHCELLIVCQPMMKSISVETSSLLDAIKLPHLLIEAPFYRSALSRIIEAYTETLDCSQGSKSLMELDSNDVHSDKGTSRVPIKDVLALEGIKILLVEDNLVNQLVAKELLASMGANVVIAENGKVGIDIIDESEVDVVLMDIQMPVMDGLTATKLLREQEKYKNLPIIAMTAHVGEADRQNSMAAGIDAHLGKPVTAKLMKETILNCIKG